MYVDKVGDIAHHLDEIWREDEGGCLRLWDV